MPAIALAAPAKTNLALEVLGRRADGYHELETVFQALELHDRVEVALEPGSAEKGVTLRCSDPSLPADQRNLAWRAAAAVAAACPGLGGIAIALEKRIPHGAGLGGGSSDAAAVLRALARLDERVGALDLLEIAAGIGSDVPYFLVGGTAHATGRGEILTALPDAPPRTVTVLMPEAHLPTPAVFGALTDDERGPREKRGAAWWRERVVEPERHLINRLAGPARRLCPPAAALLDHLAALGVPHILSGSGAACIAFGEVAAPPGVRAHVTAFRSRARLDEL